MARKKSKRRQQEDAIQAIFGIILLVSGLGTFSLTKSLSTAAVAAGIAFVLGITVMIMITLQRLERLKRSGIAEIDKMDGHKFEHYLNQLFKSQGYQSEVTQAAGDFGADLVITDKGRKIVVQAKRYTKNVGIKAVQEAIGAVKHYGASEAWVVTNRDYTEASYALAKSNGVRLVNREELIEWMLSLNTSKKTADPSAARSGPKTTVVMPKIRDTVCGRCGGNMLRRKSSKGDVLACSNYPQCRNVQPV